MDHRRDPEGLRHDAVLGAPVEHVHLLEGSESHGEAPARDARLGGHLALEVILHVGVLQVDLGLSLDGDGARWMFRVSRIERDGREAKRSKDLEADAGLAGAHVDPVDVVRLVIGAGHIEVARDAGLHGASAGVSRAVRCVPPASPRAQPSSKTHQVIFLELEPG